jgi:hypothetical protein
MLNEWLVRHARQAQFEPLPLREDQLLLLFKDGRRLLAGCFSSQAFCFGRSIY